jgi:NAD(P)H dehydrogenase (quinone)
LRFGWRNRDVKIAVTAATGHLGAEIVKATTKLIGRHSVVAIARTPSKAQALGVEVRQGDYNDGVEFEHALDGADAVLLVSGMDAPEKRVEQHRNVIGAAVTTGVKKIVYSSVQGAEEGNAFSPIIQSNRQTEEDIRTCGLDWAIGRNGIYIEPDVEYIDTYKKNGEIANCAGDGRCGYTTRPELAYAYAHLLSDSSLDGKTYNLNGEPISQQELTDHFNRTFGTDLKYRSMSVAEYREERIKELGEFLGDIIAGIYDGIRNSHFDNPSDFAAAADRAHQSWEDYFAALKAGL